MNSDGGEIPPLTSVQSGQLTEAFYSANPNYGDRPYMILNAPVLSPEIVSSLTPLQLAWWNKLIGDSINQNAAIQAAMKNK